MIDRGPSDVPCSDTRSMVEWLRAWGTLAMLRREFDPRPGHYTVGRVFSPTRQLARVSPPNMHFFPISESVYNIVLVRLSSVR